MAMYSTLSMYFTSTMHVLCFFYSVTILLSPLQIKSFLPFVVH